MDTNEAIRTMIDYSGYSQRAVSVELGRSPNWISATLQRPGSSECSTVASIGRVTGYTLALIPSNRQLPADSLVIDPSD